MRNHKERQCLYCGVKYKSWGDKFCSLKCSIAYRKENYIPKRLEATCKKCGIKFYKKYKYSKQVFCSVKCRAEYVKKNGSPRRIYPTIRHSASIVNKYFNLKRRAIRMGVAYPTSREFVEWYNKQEKKCVYCGIPFEIWELLFKGHQNKYSLSLDRKDNNRGYEIENIALACSKCNVSKNDIFTYKEMLEIGEKYIKPKWKNMLNKKELQEVS